METLQDYAPMFTHNTEGNLICTCVYHIYIYSLFHHSPFALMGKNFILWIFCHVPMISQSLRQSSPNGQINITGQSHENIWLYMYVRCRSLYDNWFFSGNSGDNLRHILFCGDQLTIERARGCQDARINSDTMKEALLGLELAVADWHAEANFLQVLSVLHVVTIIICI